MNLNLPNNDNDRKEKIDNIESFLSEYKRVIGHLYSYSKKEGNVPIGTIIQIQTKVGAFIKRIEELNKELPLLERTTSKDLYDKSKNEIITKLQQSNGNIFERGGSKMLANLCYNKELPQVGSTNHYCLNLIINNPEIIKNFIQDFNNIGEETPSRVVDDTVLGANKLL